MQNQEKVCCTEFNVALWDEKTNVWENKLFLKDYIAQIFHFPLNMGSVIKKACSRMEKEGAFPEQKDFLMMFYDPSPWKSEMYIASTKEIEGMESAKLSGTFISKVFEGPYNIIPKIYKEMEEYVQNKGMTAKKQYFHYAYCPKCSKKYGHNYIVAIAEV